MKPVILAGVTDLPALGLQPQPEPWENGWRTKDERGAFEWWYFDAQLADGSTVVVVFSAREPVVRNHRRLAPTVRITITRPGSRRPIERFKSFRAEQFAAREDRFDVAIGGCYARADAEDGVFTLHASIGGVTVDLTFTRRLPAWRPDAGVMYFDDARERSFAWLAAVPRADVAGLLHYRGTYVDVTGLGYHDHNWGNVDLYRVLAYWYWGRVHLDSTTALFVEMVTTKAYGGRRLPIAMLARDGAIVDGGIDLLPGGGGLPRPGGPEARRGYPQRLRFTWPPGGDALVVCTDEPRAINSRTLWQMVSKLRVMPLWRRLLLRLVSHFTESHYYRFRARGAVTARFEATSGSVELAESGESLYELFILR